MIEILVKGYIRMSGFPRSCHFLILFFLFRLRQPQPFFGWRFKKQRSGGSDVALDAAGKSHWAKHLQPKYCQESCGQRGTKMANWVVATQTCFIFIPTGMSMVLSK